MIQMKNNNLNKGITLISLVITIVLMLILAGVTINLAIGDNGLFGKSKNAANEYKDVSKKEIDEINSLDLDDLTLNEKSLARNMEVTYEVNNDINLITVTINSNTEASNIKEYSYKISNNNDVIKEETITTNTFNYYAKVNKTYEIFVKAKDKNDEVFEKTITVQTRTVAENKFELVGSNATASATHSNSYLPSYAFDKNKDTMWCFPVNSVQTGWLQYDFKVQAIVTKFILIEQNNGYNGQLLPKTFNLFGSNDESFSTYDDLGEYTLDTLYLGQCVTLEPKKEGAYRYYRIVILTPSGISDHYVGIGELEFYGSLAQ